MYENELRVEARKKAEEDRQFWGPSGALNRTQQELLNDEFVQNAAARTVRDRIFAQIRRLLEQAISGYATPVSPTQQAPDAVRVGASSNLSDFEDSPTPPAATPAAPTAPSGGVEARNTTNAELGLFRERDPEGAAQYDEFVRTRTQELNREFRPSEGARDNLSIELERFGHRQRSDTTAILEANEHFRERLIAAGALASQTQVTRDGNVVAERQTPPAASAPAATPESQTTPGVRMGRVFPNSDLRAPPSSTPAATQIRPQTSPSQPLDYALLQRNPELLAGYNEHIEVRSREIYEEMLPRFRQRSTSIAGRELELSFLRSTAWTRAVEEAEELFRPLLAELANQGTPVPQAAPAPTRIAPSVTSGRSLEQGLVDRPAQSAPAATPEPRTAPGVRMGRNFLNPMNFFRNTPPTPSEQTPAATPEPQTPQAPATTSNQSRTPTELAKEAIDNVIEDFINFNYNELEYFAEIKDLAIEQLAAFIATNPNYNSLSGSVAISAAGDVRFLRTLRDRISTFFTLQLPEWARREAASSNDEYMYMDIGGVPVFRNRPLTPSQIRALEYALDVNGPGTVSGWSIRPRPLPQREVPRWLVEKYNRQISAATPEQRDLAAENGMRLGNITPTDIPTARGPQGATGTEEPTDRRPSAVLERARSAGVFNFTDMFAATNRAAATAVDAVRNSTGDRGQAAMGLSTELSRSQEEIRAIIERTDRTRAQRQRTPPATPERHSSLDSSIMDALTSGFDRSGSETGPRTQGTMYAQAPDQSGVMSDAQPAQPDATRVEEPAPEAPAAAPEQRTTTQQEGARPTNRDLTFGPGVDRRLEQGIASKVGQIESSFGKRLIVTSGFRDPARNARVGGARNSAHTRGNAVDVTFSGNEQDTNKLIEVASSAGIGGIGVYRPGWVHLDTENKRVWGPDFSARSIPQWARRALDAHMTGRREDAQATPAETPAAQMQQQPHAEPVEAAPETQAPQQPDAQPVTEPTGQDGMGGGELMSGTTPGAGATPTAAAPQGGMQVMQASQENAVAERTPSPPAVAPSMSTPAGDASPGTPVPTTQQSSTDPGRVEPEDAAERYARLFNMAA